MTPQSQLTVVAPVDAARQSALRDLLATLNSTPGNANPQNALVPFASFPSIHFARFSILTDATLGDLQAYDLPAPQLPVYLAFVVDCDGPAHATLADLAKRAGTGLRAIFSHCVGFDGEADLLTWMRDHDRPIAASYVNRVGRTAEQIKEEDALQRSLAARVNRTGLANPAEAQARRQELVTFAQGEIKADRLRLTPPQPTPFGWWLARCFNAIAGVVIGLLALAPLILFSPLLLLTLRRHERHDPEICPRPDRNALMQLQRLEDFDVTNQYTALGMLKPGKFRLWLVTAVLAIIQFTCRHIFVRGYLARVQTIHFARWVLLDNKTRVLFTSNYDGGHQAYMDDFINKVAWGLNVIFSNGLGWPKTDWLLLRGARREERFKLFQRRHQLETQVWYNAYPGLTLINLTRNSLIRRGLQQARMTDAEALAWLQLL